MYLHIGQNTVIRTDDIIGIFDMETSTVSQTTRHVLAQAEKAQIQAVLNLCDGDVPRAAAQLGIHRSVLYKKINKYQLRHRTVYELD